MAKRSSVIEAKNRILSACVKMFIEKGYKETTMLDIIREAGVSAGTFQNIFRTKDGVLTELVNVMFDNQFSTAESIVGGSSDPVLLYSVELAVQMTLAELNENLRQIYVEAYTQPKINEYICQKTSSELYKLFGGIMPQYSESDFYESDIGNAGIMRAYMARPCDKYFTLERKLEKLLRMTLNSFDIPKDKQNQVVDYVDSLDMRSIADGVMQKLFETLAMKFDFSLAWTIPLILNTSVLISLSSWTVTVKAAAVLCFLRI